MQQASLVWRCASSERVNICFQLLIIFFSRFLFPVLFILSMPVQSAQQTSSVWRSASFERVNICFQVFIVFLTLFVSISFQLSQLFHQSSQLCFLCTITGHGHICKYWKNVIAKRLRTRSGCAFQSREDQSQRHLIGCHRGNL